MREKDRKGRKVAKHCVFPMICGSGGSKSRLAKAAGAEPAGQMRNQKLHAVVARSTFRSQNVQNTPWSDHFWKLRCRKSARRCGAKHISKSKLTRHHCRTTFGSWDVEKVHAVVARSTFPSQNVQNTTCSRHFWRFRCRKSARRCGAKHISKSKCTKHTLYGPFLEVRMSFRVAGARDCGPCQKWAKREGFVAFSTTTTTTLHYTPIHYTTLHYNYNYNYASLHSTTLHPTTLHCTQLHSITLHYTTLHYTTLQYTTLHYTTLHYNTLHYTTFHYATLHYTPLHYITLHYITLHYITLHSTTLHLHLQLHSTTLNYTTLDYTTLHYIPRHYTTLYYTTLHYIHWMTLHHR